MSKMKNPTIYNHNLHNQLHLTLLLTLLLTLSLLLRNVDSTQSTIAQQPDQATLPFGGTTPLPTPFGSTIPNGQLGSPTNEGTPSFGDSSDNPVEQSQPGPQQQKPGQLGLTQPVANQPVVPTQQGANQPLGLTQPGTNQPVGLGQQGTNQQIGSAQQGINQQIGLTQQGTNQQTGSAQQGVNQQTGLTQQGTNQQTVLGQQGTNQLPFAVTNQRRFANGNNGLFNNAAGGSISLKTLPFVSLVMILSFGVLCS